MARRRTWSLRRIGPGFRSAYGLVVGYFVTPGEHGRSDVDNGIRAHGSADYLSIGSSGAFHTAAIAC